LPKQVLESFEGIAREWHQKFSKGLSEKYSDLILRRFEQDVFPWIGKRPIAQIESSEMLALLRQLESRGALETTHRIKQKCSSVFCYAVSTGRAQRDPTTGLNGAIPPARVKHHASITEPKKIGELLRAVDGYQGFFVTRCALQLAPLVFLRPGELR
jgi:hypothetical protein